jgi:predicted transcriptional regulator
MMAATTVRSSEEFVKLIRRLKEIAPLVRSQQREANRHAIARFDAKDEPAPAEKPGTGRRVDTPEARELRSIGLAIAAFGGAYAILEVGWQLTEQGGSDEDRITLWSWWDGFAGYGL